MLALINPPLNLTRGYKVGFAVSDTLSHTSGIWKGKQKSLTLISLEILTLQIHILITLKMVDSKLLVSEQWGLQLLLELTYL